MNLTLILILLVAYLVGAIPCGVLLTRLVGAGDVRQSGSGNIGATNVYRVAGRRLGLLTLVGDTLKGVLPVACVLSFSELPTQQVSLVAAATFLGHLYPVYIGFKGGKGVATALGIYLVLAPLAVCVALLLFIALLWKWRYVSLASITSAAAIPLVAYLLDPRPVFLAVSLFISGMVIVRHHQNIRRLLAGTENRFNL
jgi:glycerol-3-phosphate acyltransferase PlsY